MIPDSSNRSKTILTTVVYSFLNHKPSEFSIHWDLCGQVRDENGYFGYLRAVRQSGKEITLFFHTDNIYKPTWIAIIVPRAAHVYLSMQADPTLIPEYFTRDHTRNSMEFLFFDLSDFQGGGTGDETWAQKSGVVIGDKRVGPNGHYINHGWERYQDMKSFAFRASINNAKL